MYGRALLNAHFSDLPGGLHAPLGAFGIHLLSPGFLLPVSHRVSLPPSLSAFGWGPDGAGLAHFASSLHSRKPAEVAEPCSGKVLSLGEAFSSVLPRSWAGLLRLSRESSQCSSAW